MPYLEKAFLIKSGEGKPWCGWVGKHIWERSPKKSFFTPSLSRLHRSNKTNHFHRGSSLHIIWNCILSSEKVKSPNWPFSSCVPALRTNLFDIWLKDFLRETGGRLKVSGRTALGARYTLVWIGNLMIMMMIMMIIIFCGSAIWWSWSCHYVFSNVSPNCR